MLVYDLKMMKRDVDDRNSDLIENFRKFSIQCEYMKTMSQPDVWWKCTNKDYNFAKYNDNTGCCVDECPLLK